MTATAAEDGLHLQHQSGSLDVQLLILAGNDPRRPLAAVVPLDVDGLDRIAATERLWRTLHDRAVPAGSSVTPQQRTSLKQMLRAVDGRAAHATQREIAAALFGAARVADYPWKSSPLRDKVNRLMRGGNAMIAGGYRKLLRQSRRV